MEIIGGLIGLVLLGILLFYAVRIIVYLLGILLVSGLATALVAGIAQATGHPMSDEAIGGTWFVLFVLMAIGGFFGWLGELFGFNNNENHNEVAVESHNENHLDNHNDNSNHNQIVINNYIPGAMPPGASTPEAMQYHRMNAIEGEHLQPERPERIEVRPLAVENRSGRSHATMSPQEGATMATRNRTEMTRILDRPMDAIGKGVSWLKGLVQGVPGIPVRAGEEVLVGRSAAATIRIDNGYVSGKHLKLSLAPDGSVEVTDLGSTNGTYINAQKLVPNRHYRLNAGDRLILGSDDVVYQVA
jgi:hypothetical protein